MSKGQLNKIIQHTPIDQPVRLKKWHYGVCVIMGGVGLGLYYANLDDPTWENIFTNYLGVLLSNFAGIVFAGKDYFQDKLERDIPKELKGLLVPESHRTSLIVSGSLAAALPYAGMTWESAPISYFSSDTTNNSLTALFAIATWLVNAFMNNIPVRDVLEKIAPLGTYCRKKLPCKSRRGRGDYALLDDFASESKLSDSHAKIITQIDRALDHVLLLDDTQLIALYRVIQSKNREEKNGEAEDEDYFEDIMAAAFPAPQLTINSSLLWEEKSKDSRLCVQSRTRCVDALDHNNFKKIILLGGFLFAILLLLADSQYVKDSSEDVAATIGFGYMGQKIFAWLMVCLAMFFAAILNTDFCRGTLQYLVDWVSGPFNPRQTKNFGSRFYEYPKLVMTGAGGYCALFSAEAGLKIYGDKISNRGIVETAGIGIRLFNARGLFELIEARLKDHASDRGKPPAQAASRIISFFNLLKRRVNMLPKEQVRSGYEL